MREEQKIKKNPEGSRMTTQIKRIKLASSRRCRQQPVCKETGTRGHYSSDTTSVHEDSTGLCRSSFVGQALTSDLLFIYTRHPH